MLKQSQNSTDAEISPSTEAIGLSKLADILAKIRNGKDIEASSRVISKVKTICEAYLAS